MKRALFIFNMRSGKGAIKGKLAEIIDLMIKAGYEVTAHPTQGRGDAIALVEETAGEYDLVVCSGGDGTLDETVTGMMRRQNRVPIGYIPTGSTNDFGATLKIPRDPLKAADIAANGRDFPFDVGSFNDDSFVYIAAFGLFTDVSYITSQQMKNVFGHAAYLMEVAKKAGQPIPGYALTVEIDGQTIEDRFAFGMITNSSSIGGIKDFGGKNVDLADGLLEVTLIREPANPLELSEILACLANLVTDSPLIYTYKTDHIMIRAEEPLSWTLDGEYGGTYREADIHCIKQAVSIRIRTREPAMKRVTMTTQLALE